MPLRYTAGPTGLDIAQAAHRKVPGFDLSREESLSFQSVKIILPIIIELWQVAYREVLLLRDGTFALIPQRRALTAKGSEGH